MKKTVVVGMSGGVDSSVAAFLLKEQGYHVIGIFMKNWDDESDYCSAASDFEDVLKVAKVLDIPCYTFNFAAEYKEKVFKDFLSDLNKGLTPNPDILCNREIKFDRFFKKAMELGADYLATGHYVQISERNQLFKGVDPDKDQSYFLHALKDSILKNVLFPLGHLKKSEVKKIAKEAGLHIFNKKESMGICFIGKRNFKDFLNQYISYSKGPIKTLDEKTIGEHEGSAFYTIGQRKGLKIGGSGDAWFVAKKDHKKNIIYAVQGQNHPALYKKNLIASSLTWINEQPPIPIQLQAKIRYRQKDQECFIKKIENNLAHVEFKNPQRAVTPGQSIVFYKGSQCLGGGIILP